MKMKFINIRICTLVFVVMSLIGVANAQINVVSNQTATALANKLAGAGVTVSNAVFNNCDTQANGIFTVVSSPIGLDSGIVLSSGRVSNAFGPSGTPAFANSDYYDPDLDLLTNSAIRDACVLEFDFIPIGDTVKFNYIFASAEYLGYTCSVFEDVFGFFVSGPGLTGIYSLGAVNLALVPGTSCPITINTINGSTSSPCGTQSAPCSPPNNALYISNLPIGNNLTGLAYNGYTQVMQAITAVTPCSTYHMKLAISDAVDQTLDTGVLLEAGSLSSNAITFTPVTTLNNPQPYVVEGCSPGGILITRPVATALPYIINYVVGGTATMGTDYNSLSGTATILAGQTTTIIPIIANSDGIAEGPETVIIYKTNGCASTITDSATIFIYDSLIMEIITPDTTICIGDSVHMLTNGDPNLHLNWFPNFSVSNDTSTNPYVYPTTTTTYTLEASLPGSGCDTVRNTVTVTINPYPVFSLGPDLFLCKGMTHQFNPVVTPVQPYTYAWNNGAFLSATNIPNPVGTFTNTGTYTYILQVDPVAPGCANWDTIVVEVLPNDFILHNNDTTICENATVFINVTGDPRFHYQWTPPNYVSNDTIQDPMITPPVGMNSYVITASYPGCPNMVHDIDINVEPNPNVDLGPDREMCQYDTIQLNPIIGPPGYTYFYTWKPSIGLSSGSTKDVLFTDSVSRTYTLVVNTPKGCKDSDMVNITVWPGNFLTVQPRDTQICPLAAVPLRAQGAVNYDWAPNWDISNNLIANPIATPTATNTYTLIGTSINGCLDTATSHIFVAANGVLNLGEDITLFPGDAHHFTPGTNCSYFTWAPSIFLNNTQIPDPTVSNANTTTQYVVMASTEYGCSVTDTVVVNVVAESVINIPNAFTPGNGNHQNDLFKLDKLGIAKLNYLRIFNRWGQLVFETTDINQGWDGRKNGVPQPMGTYVYQVDAETFLQKKFIKTGNITLIR
jgi:gliding motility-associated-like protein